MEIMPVTDLEFSYGPPTIDNIASIDSVPAGECIVYSEDFASIDRCKPGWWAKAYIEAPDIDGVYSFSVDYFNTTSTE